MLRSKKVVSLVVLTNSIFCFSLSNSQLMAMAIPVRGAKFNALQFIKNCEAFFFVRPNAPYAIAILSCPASSSWMH
ncbi:hypothetical protein FGI04_05095 [Dickeya ananatis]|nr:hypothetical protein FGI04_05095 [Dickeya zeae]